jgi:hypothetical protein
MTDHGHEQTVVGLRRHTQVHRVVRRQRLGGVVVVRVEPRLLRACDRHRPGDEREQREPHATITALAVELVAQPLQLTDVDGVDIRDVRDLGPGQRQPLGDAAAHAANRFFATGGVAIDGLWRGSLPHARRFGDGSIEIGMHDPPTRARAFDVRQVQPQRARPFPHGGRRSRSSGDGRVRLWCFGRDALGRFGSWAWFGLRRRDGLVVVRRLADRWRRRRAVVGRLRRRCFDLDEIAPHREHITGLAMQCCHNSRDGRRDLDRRLVGEHLGQHRLGGHLVADGDEPLHELGLGDTLADIGQPHPVRAHAATTSRIARPTRSGPGKYDHSRACG